MYLILVFGSWNNRASKTPSFLSVSSVFFYADEVAHGGFLDSFKMGTGQKDQPCNLRLGFGASLTSREGVGTGDRAQPRGSALISHVCVTKPQ